MRVLVTGGSGFIGSHVVDKLIAHGHEPVIFDLRPSPWHDAHAVEQIQGSITDREELEAALHGCDAVAHLAAVADVNDVHAAPENAEVVNTHGTVTVLEAARRAGVKRVVYASTIWVYSDCEPDTVDEETLPAPPSHLYTSTKLAGEHYCKSYHELYGIEYTILRFGIPYGPRAREAAVIPAFVGKALRGEPLTLAGDGMQYRRFVYVEDLAEGVARGLVPEAANRIYNLASAETVTIKQIAETVQELIGDVEITYTPARPGDFGGKVVLSERAEQELGWTAATPFSEGVRRYVEWRRSREEAATVAHVPAVTVEEEPEPHPRRILVISADIGEGHDLPARALVREFHEEDSDAQVSVVNGLAAMGKFATSILRDGSAVMFRWMPWLFDLQYFLFMRVAPTRWLSRKLITLVGRRSLMRLIRAHDPDLIVSTYPGVTVVLGELRRKRRLDVPCYSSITDLAGLHFWAHPGIDLHLVTHPESIEEVEAVAGPGSVRWAKPPTSPDFLVSRDPGDARRALGLPAEGKVIVVSGGGWGVGDLTGAIRTALAVEGATVVCLCGRNDGVRERLAQRFAESSRLRLVGFTHRMGDMLAAADVLVHSTAGLTVLEAIIRGCPVVSYGFGVGHVRTNNTALERFGLAQVARSQAELGPALTRALDHRPAPDDSFAHRPSSASFIFSDERRAMPKPVWRLRTARTAIASGLALIAALWVLSTNDSYTILARALGAKPVTSVATDHRQVGILLDVPRDQIPAVTGELAAQHLRASFAIDGVPSSSELALARLAGDEVVPRLRSGGAIRWLGTKGSLRRLAGQMGLHRHFVYAVPGHGLTLGQYLLARSAGGRPVAGAIRLDRGDHIGAVSAGQLIEIEIPRDGDVRAILAELHARLAVSGLSGVPVGVLLRTAGRPA